MSEINLRKKIALLTTGTILLLLTVALPAASATPSDPVTFTSPNAQASGVFGLSVAVSNTSIVVGAPLESASGFSQAGHVYIFSPTGSLTATLTSPNPQTFGNFGWSVAASDTSIVVGALAEGPGHVYIFSPTGSLTATLNSPNAQPGGDFGVSVALSGTSIVVGAINEASAGFAAGHAYICSTAGCPITLTTPNPATGGQFGHSVAVNGTSIVVGAPREGFFGHPYIFSPTGSLTATLNSPNASLPALEDFGISVAASGSSVFVGDGEANAAGSIGAGHVYIFSPTGSLSAALTSPNVQAAGDFGESVAVSGASIIVGAPGAPGNGIVGHAYVCSTAGCSTTFTSPSAEAGGGFGQSVATRGTSIVVGAPLESASGFSQAGHAYFFGLRATSTTVSCSKVKGSITCTITVTDTSPGTSITPTGTVAMSSTGTGTFTSCAFSGASSSATCTVTYTPGKGKTSIISITGTYSGDTDHFGSSGSTTIKSS